MTLLDIHLLGAPILRTRSPEIDRFDDTLRLLVADMFETMDAAEGVGLAANQVGLAMRVAVVGVEGERFALINPVITHAEGRSRAEEGCLSIPELFGEVTRAERIVLRAVDPQGEPWELEAEGLLARAIQHEIDHLDGILFLDHLSVLKRQMLQAKWRKEHKGKELVRRFRPA